MRKSGATVAITRYEKKEMTMTTDAVVIKEPLEIYIGGKPHYLSMRMPGEEICLALGYCFSEGIIDSTDDVHIVQYCGEEAGNRVEIALARKRRAARGKRAPDKKRALPTYSSCGICSKEMVEDIYMKLNSREKSCSVPVSRIDHMMEEVEKRQQIFGETGATHAAAIFNRDFELLVISEDIVRLLDEMSL